jgi:putative peptidoglycan lipid II flippase
LLLALPAAAALALLAVPLTATLFHYGAFSAADVLATRGAVVAYSVGLVGLILVKILAPGFYAQQDIRTPVRIAVVTLLATQVMNLILIWPLKHVGLALAIGLGACLNASLLYRALRRRGIYTPQAGWPVFLLKVIVAVYAMAAVLWVMSGASGEWIAAGGAQRVVRLVWVIAAGAASYFAVLWLLGFRASNFVKRV